MIIIFDTETTGLPEKFDTPYTETDKWPRLVQLAWEVYDFYGKKVKQADYIIRPDNFEIPEEVSKIHGITTEIALKKGVDLKYVLEEFNKDLEKAQILVAHNIEFDINIIKAEYIRTNLPDKIDGLHLFCTKKNTTEFCALSGGKNGKYKWPNLSQLYNKLFNSDFDNAHNAAADVNATAKCFFELIKIGEINSNNLKISPEDFEKLISNLKNSEKYMKHNNEIIVNQKTSIYKNFELELNNFENEEIEITNGIEDNEITIDKENNFEYRETEISEIPFIHLHVHTQYSILDGACEISKLIERAKTLNMPSVAITDHGNMFGVKEFYDEAKKAGVKPIIGCEMYVARRFLQNKHDKLDSGGYHLTLLAKNKKGYHNLVKLISKAWVEGFYYKPRIDKNLLKQYSEGLIALSGCLNGEIPSLLLNNNYKEALNVALEFKSIFGEDFYLEIQKHPSDDPIKNQQVYNNQLKVNELILKISKETGIKVVATNDVHFIYKEDAPAHDHLLCISTGKDIDDPNRLRYTQQEWFKSKEEMLFLFSDLPEALDNTWEIAQKVENYELNHPPIMPDFPLPEGFNNADEYLEYLTYEGAKERYGDITPQIKERLDFELSTIKKMGFPGYFLIVWDLIKAAREMGISVGPGRGSAAGSAVAYCLKITDIDPIKYDLLFERFLNPDRISMPDIDIDFDEDGREKILKWVVNKYGKDHVAHIITFGTMAPKMAIRDVARVQKLELSEADRLAKLVPERPGITFKKAYEESPDLKKERESGKEKIVQTLKYAEVLEGSIRQTGLHACGIIISREKLDEYIPICTHKDSELYVTQYEGKHIESVGMLKMDFLGLKTLSIINDTLKNIKKSKNIDIDISKIPLDDSLTYELYSKGETNGIFQFESDGMKKYLKMLKPNRFEDLIAMNALYRPGPMDYIPSYINRKHGRETINYDLPEMEEYLKDTYGITVYQEQVMLLSQKLAGFTKGMADSLRKAMGKKIKSMMDQLKEKFIEGCKNNGHDVNTALKIWSDWEAFAEYAFNKSHSTCYAYISYQTAYLKAHYPAEFMAAVLSRNLSDIKKVTFFLDECRRMGINVLVPDINESDPRFTVNTDGNIRFGLAAIKDVGEAAVECIINEREKNGPFKNVYDFFERINLSTVNKRSLEALIKAGCFDSLNQVKRHQFFLETEKNTTFLEQLIKYGNRYQDEKNTSSIFGEIFNVEIKKPEIPEGPEWSIFEKLKYEKEHIGVYLSSHPLDNYKLEIKLLCNTQINQLNENLANFKGKDITFAAIVTDVKHFTTKTGKFYGTITLEDYTGSLSINLFGKDYENFRIYMYQNYSLLIKATVAEGWKNEELEIKIKSMQLLDNARNDLFKTLYIKIPVKEINNNFLEILKANTKPGNTILKIKIYDPESNVYIDMQTKNKSIYINDSLISFLETNPEIQYSILTN